MRHRAIWLAGLMALLVAAALVALLVTSLLDIDHSRTPPSPADNASSITSEQAVTTAKEWIAGGTEAAYVHDLLADLACNGYFQGRGTWEIRCRLPWIPVEGYFFRVSEFSGEVQPQTEATLAFVRLLRGWGHVPEP